MIKELNFPVVYKEDRVIGYGGNQEWFLRSWRRQAGCASTSGANIAAYYAYNYPEMRELYKGNSMQFNQGEYLQVMEEMYKYMTPGIFGYPYVEKFAKQFIRFCKERGVPMEASIMGDFNRIEEAFLFVKKNIDGGQPVALLILFHHGIELKGDNWHWVTITGYIKDNNDIVGSKVTLSNGGQRKIVNTEVLFEVHPKNKIRMVSFYPSLSIDNLVLSDYNDLK